MTCNWRKLEADGQVLACTSDEAHLTVSHGTVVGDGIVYVWDNADPCAWDATCPACKGVRNEFGERVGCTRCDGAGTVDTIPAHLIGVGSVVEGPVDLWGGSRVYRVILVEWHAADGCYSGWVYGPVTPPETVIRAEWIGSRWTLVRAVPPAPVRRPVLP